MKQIFLNSLFLLLGSCSFGQCLSGNCKDGKGKYDFGWCVYEGYFKNERPDGQGVMKYEDYTYTGSFKNGLEDGKGVILYNNGRKEEVTYSSGKKLEVNPPPLKEGAYQPLAGHDEHCLSGDCNNGFGTYEFPSGNKYTGNFKDRKREGEGTFYFANGERFSGIFHNNNFSNGTYVFSSGASYTGTYDAFGQALNGVASMGTNRVTIAGGKPIIPKPPQATNNTATTTAKTPNKPKIPVINWAPSSGNSSTNSSTLGSSVDKMLDRMNRPTYTHW